jgi:hypothetical protein
MLRLALTTIAAVLTQFAFASSARAADWIWPVQGEVITSYRNVDDPYAGGQHRGIDIAGPVGTPVVAAAGGEVRFAGTAGSSGLTVSVRTADGRFDTSYLHLSSITVRKGQHVPTGGRLGAVGTTGRRSAERPHLHFGVREAGTRHDYVDPRTLLPAPPVTRPEPSPRAAPAPQPAPPAAAPKAAPLPGFAPSPRRAPVGSPRRVPNTSPGRVPHVSPHRVPRASPRHFPNGSPHRVPGVSPHRIPAGSPHRIPAGPPHRVPAGAPHRGPAGSLRHVPAASPRHRPAGSPADVPAQSPRGLPHDAPSHAPAGSNGGPAAGRHLPDTTSASPGNGESPHAHGAGAPASGSHGPDIGWVLACLGLLLAAGVIGLGVKGNNPPDRASTPGGRLVALIRPLGGRG